MSLRCWLGELTGLRGEALSELIEVGALEGARVELSEQVSTMQVRASRAPQAGVLTVAQLQVLELMATEGLSAPEAAVRLHLSVWTVRDHLTGARTRLGARSVAQAVWLAVVSGQLVLP